MVEGLKVTIDGTELKQLCIQRAEHHEARTKVYMEQVESMEAAKIQGANYTNGDPVRALKAKMDEHDNEARELRFYADHIDQAEAYLLSHNDLHKLGIVERNHY